MQRAYNKNTNGPVTEMAIVNTFTKLIFGDEGFTARELSIIQAFRAVDVDANAVDNLQGERWRKIRDSDGPACVSVPQSVAEDAKAAKGGTQICEVDQCSRFPACVCPGAVN